jgi:hypothetical protein
MSGEDDEIEDDEMPVVEEHDPASAKQATKGPSQGLQLLLADFQTRAKGLDGPAFQQELDRLIDKMVDRAAGVAPPALRAKVREQIYEMLINDPTMKILIDDVRRTIRS